ncbi:MAG TPA: GNAT family N-acetyltransferase [Thermoanaerobaculia bacterium]|nr:GNAT family N-acetyltransferase [Thermoanaerobaculia bacterium]
MTHLRKATRDDVDAIMRVMRASLGQLAAGVYDARQIASSIEYVARPDTQLIDDGTYSVIEIDGAVVACGGWSRRGKLYSGSGDEDARALDPATEPARVRAMFVDPQFARRGLGRMILDACEREAAAEGFRRVELMALRSGERMYLACGYEPLENVPVVLEDGVVIDCTRMTRPI